MIHIRVEPGTSPLTSGILRAVLYEDDPVRADCVQCFGLPLVEWADKVLRETYEVGGDLTITDCPIRIARPQMYPESETAMEDGSPAPLREGEVRVCSSDHRNHPAHLYRCQGEDAEETLLPAFPHGLWPPNNPDWMPRIRPSEFPWIGFMGRGRPEIRAEALHHLRCWERTGEVLADIVERQKFMGREVGVRAARHNYLEHMQRCDYQLCVRGVGNFCYRLYETLSWGRIPIVIGQRALPWADEIEWENRAVLVTDPVELQAITEDWHARNLPILHEIQASNRRLWLEKLSPGGWWARYAQEIA